MSRTEMQPTDEQVRLVAERDVLLRSLDDLESERAAGGIDEESYQALHDDYTARAAAVIRALRDGVDSRPAAPSPTRSNRVLVVLAIVVFAIGAGVALAAAIGDRRSGETASGNSSDRASSNASTSERVRKRLEAAVSRNPSDVASRLLLARTLEQDDDLEGALRQFDAIIEIDPANAEAHANAGRILYLVGSSAPEADVAALMERSKVRLDTAVALDPEFADARYFRAVLLAFEFQDFRTAQGDLQRYLIAEPEGLFAEAARELLADVAAALESATTTTS